ncbi:hypothetical protein DFJ74DRAFT_695460 [Hyaloraphidium curvatum]|nr:hypothetical protein DFJ74DRAFT_695460 [Hyaloraphidium curvatum]
MELEEARHEVQGKQAHFHRVAQHGPKDVPQQRAVELQSLLVGIQPSEGVDDRESRHHAPQIPGDERIPRPPGRRGQPRDAEQWRSHPQVGVLLGQIHAHRKPIHARAANFKVHEGVSHVHPVLHDEPVVHPAGEGGRNEAFAGEPRPAEDGHGMAQEFACVGERAELELDGSGGHDQGVQEREGAEVAGAALVLWRRSALGRHFPSYPKEADLAFEHGLEPRVALRHDGGEVHRSQPRHVTRPPACRIPLRRPRTAPLERGGKNFRVVELRPSGIAGVVRQGAFGDSPPVKDERRVGQSREEDVDQRGGNVARRGWRNLRRARHVAAGARGVILNPAVTAGRTKPSIPQPGSHRPKDFPQTVPH